jgi:hypothetical protein
MAWSLLEVSPIIRNPGQHRALPSVAEKPQLVQNYDLPGFKAMPHRLWNLSAAAAACI